MHSHISLHPAQVIRKNMFQEFNQNLTQTVAARALRAGCFKALGP